MIKVEHFKESPNYYILNCFFLETDINPTFGCQCAQNVKQTLAIRLFISHDYFKVDNIL